MAIRAMFNSLFKGDISDAANYAFMSQSDIDNATEFQSKADARIAAQYEAGLIDVSKRDDLLRLAAGTTAFPEFDDSNLSPVGGFTEGIGDGADNIRKFVGGAMNTTAGTFLRLIPWQIWLILLIVAAFYTLPIWSRFIPKVSK